MCSAGKPGKLPISHSSKVECFHNAYLQCLGGDRLCSKKNSFDCFGFLKRDQKLFLFLFSPVLVFFFFYYFGARLQDIKRCAN